MLVNHIVQGAATKNLNVISYRKTILNSSKNQNYPVCGRLKFIMQYNIPRSAIG